MCTTLGIGKNNMRHHVPWVRQDDYEWSGHGEWSGAFDYLHVHEGWQLSDFSAFLGRQGTIKACLHFPQLIEGNLIHLLLEYPSLRDSKTPILDLFPRPFWPREKPSHESSLVSATIFGSRTVLVGRRFIFRYFGHLD